MKSLFLPFLICFAVACQDANRAMDSIERDLVPTDSINLADRGFVIATSIALADSTFYVIDASQKEIVKTDDRFQPMIRYKAIGRGPGEFLDPFDLAVSQTAVYLIDLEQRKIIALNRDLNPVDEMVTTFPPFSLLPLGNEILLVGSFDMEYEDAYLISISSKTETRHELSVKTNSPLESISFHLKSESGVLLRYRQYGNRLDLLKTDGEHLVFSNPTQPTRPELDSRSPELAIFTSKTHHSAFLTQDRACVLSGDHSPGNQPVQCFDFDGQLVARYVLKQDPSMISVYADSTLYTYSPKTNHVYVYNLGF